MKKIVSITNTLFPKTVEQGLADCFFGQSAEWHISADALLARREIIVDQLLRYVADIRYEVPMTYVFQRLCQDRQLAEAIVIPFLDRCLHTGEDLFFLKRFPVLVAHAPDLAATHYQARFERILAEPETELVNEFYQQLDHKTLALAGLLALAVDQPEKLAALKAEWQDRVLKWLEKLRGAGLLSCLAVFAHHDHAFVADRLLPVLIRRDYFSKPSAAERELIKALREFPDLLKRALEETEADQVSNLERSCRIRLNAELDMMTGSEKTEAKGFLSHLLTQPAYAYAAYEGIQGFYGDHEWIIREVIPKLFDLIPQEEGQTDAIIILSKLTDSDPAFAAVINQELDRRLHALEPSKYPDEDRFILLCERLWNRYLDTDTRYQLLVDHAPFLMGQIESETTRPAFKHLQDTLVWNLFLESYNRDPLRFEQEDLTGFLDWHADPEISPSQLKPALDLIDTIAPTASELIKKRILPALENELDSHDSTLQLRALDLFQSIAHHGDPGVLAAFAPRIMALLHDSQIDWRIRERAQKVVIWDLLSQDNDSASIETLSGIEARRMFSGESLDALLALSIRDLEDDNLFEWAIYIATLAANRSGRELEVAPLLLDRLEKSGYADNVSAALSRMIDKKPEVFESLLPILVEKSRAMPTSSTNVHFDLLVKLLADWPHKKSAHRDAVRDQMLTLLDTLKQDPDSRNQRRAGRLLAALLGAELFDEPVIQRLFEFIPNPAVSTEDMNTFVYKHLTPDQKTTLFIQLDQLLSSHAFQALDQWFSQLYDLNCYNPDSPELQDYVTRHYDALIRQDPQVRNSQNFKIIGHLTAHHPERQLKLNQYISEQLRQHTGQGQALTESVFQLAAIACTASPGGIEQHAKDLIRFADAQIPSPNALKLLTRIATSFPEYRQTCRDCLSAHYRNQTDAYDRSRIVTALIEGAEFDNQLATDFNTVILPDLLSELGDPSLNAAVRWGLAQKLNGIKSTCAAEFRETIDAHFRAIMQDPSEPVLLRLAMIHFLEDKRLQITLPEFSPGDWAIVRKNTDALKQLPKSNSPAPQIAPYFLGSPDPEDLLFPDQNHPLKYLADTLSHTKASQFPAAIPAGADLAGKVPVNNPLDNQAVLSPEEGRFVQSQGYPDNVTKGSGLARPGLSLPIWFSLRDNQRLDTRVVWGGNPITFARQAFLGAVELWSVNLLTGDIPHTLIPVQVLNVETLPIRTGPIRTISKPVGELIDCGRFQALSAAESGVLAWGLDRAGDASDPDQLYQTRTLRQSLLKQLILPDSEHPDQLDEFARELDIQLENHCANRPVQSLKALWDTPVTITVSDRISVPVQKYLAGLKHGKMASESIAALSPKNAAYFSRQLDQVQVRGEREQEMTQVYQAGRRGWMTPAFEQALREYNLRHQTDLNAYELWEQQLSQLGKDPKTILETDATERLYDLIQSDSDQPEILTSVRRYFQNELNLIRAERKAPALQLDEVLFEKSQLGVFNYTAPHADLRLRDIDTLHAERTVWETWGRAQEFDAYCAKLAAVTDPDKQNALEAQMDQLRMTIFTEFVHRVGRTLAHVHKWGGHLDGSIGSASIKDITPTGHILDSDAYVLFQPTGDLITGRKQLEDYENYWRTCQTVAGLLHLPEHALGKLIFETYSHALEDTPKVADPKQLQRDFAAAYGVGGQIPG